MLTAETITDADLRELLYQSAANGNFQVVREAVGEACIWFEFGEFTGYRFPTGAEIDAARSRCAEILNARSAK